MSTNTIVSQPSKAIVSTWCKCLLQAIYLSKYVTDNMFLLYWKVFKTKKQNGRQIYCEIYHKHLSSIKLVYLHIQGGNLSKSNPLCLFKAIYLFAAILLLVITKKQAIISQSLVFDLIKYARYCYHYHVLAMCS